MSDLWRSDASRKSKSARSRSPASFASSSITFFAKRMSRHCASGDLSGVRVSDATTCGEGGEERGARSGVRGGRGSTRRRPGGKAWARRRRGEHLRDGEPVLALDLVEEGERVVPTEMFSE